MRGFIACLVILSFSSHAASRTIADYGVYLGFTKSQNIERLGEPSLEGELNGYTIYGYCLKAGFKVVGQTLLFENDRLVWSQGFKTRCGKNFRLKEINW